MPYPNSSVLNVVIPQTSASLQGGQAPFVERIISGSRLILQTTTDGTLTGSSDLNVNSITASNISASGYISASNLWINTNITDSGSLTVVGATTLAGLTATTATFSGLVSASAGLTASAIYDSGSLTVIGTSTLAGLTATTATFSGLVSASAGLTASAIYDSGSLTVVGNSTLNNVFATNITASNITASGQVTAAGFTGSLFGTSSWSSNSINSLSSSISSINDTTTYYVTFVDGTSGFKPLKTDTDILSYQPSTNTLNVGTGGIGILNVGPQAGAAGLKVTSTATNASVDIAGGSFETASFTVNTNEFVVKAGASLNPSISTSLATKITNTTQATSWADGALSVAGGVGVGKNLYVSGSTWLYGDLTIFGSSSVVYISSSTVIINDNIIQLNAYFPYERYAGFEVYDSGSAQRSASLLWDGQNDNWITVDQNNTSSNIILGPTASFGNDPGSLTANNIPKAYDATGITTSSLSDDGTTLTYVGTTISSSRLLATTGSITYINGTLSTYSTGSFTALTVITGSAPGTGSQVPATPTSPGMHGQIEVDNNFIYVYTNNIWKRVPLSNWAP